MISSTLISVFSLLVSTTFVHAQTRHSNIPRRPHETQSEHEHYSNPNARAHTSHRHHRPRAPYNPTNPHRGLLSRSITQDVATASGASYDFIISGGGLAGLAVAARLSEWSNVTVLVVEAGPSGDEHQDQINIPGYSYLHSLGGTIYDWNYTTVPQADSLDRVVNWPRGRGLGGSGAVNGLYWCWAAKEEYDAWAELNPDGDQTWDWDEMFKYMKKAETFTDAPATTKQTMGMVTEMSNHGTSGPIHIGFSQFMYDAVSAWLPSWEAMGLKSMDLFGGDTRGAAITPSTLNARNQTRSDARAGYIDPLPPRDNLVILTGYQVTEVLFSQTDDANGNKVASGVKFSAGPGQQEHFVQANKEVILSGGTVGSPALLQLSGIGPQDKLADAGVQTKIDLPVGYNLQDHLSWSMYFSTPPNTPTWGDLQNDQALQAEQLAQWRDSATGQWTFINEAIAFPALGDLMTASGARDYAANVQAALSKTAADVTSWQVLPQGVSASLSKQYAIQQRWLTTGVGQIEYLLTMLGRNGAKDQVGIQMALQHPWSRGSLFINSSDPFAPPAINPDYLGVGYDIDLMGYAAEYARKLAKIAPMSRLAITETYPGASATGDALAKATRESCTTEYHPLGTCSMLPKDEGGVVDTNLIVYGTSNVRVVDSSIMPLQISAHLMASTYGIAEKAADIIKQKHFAVIKPSSSDATTSVTPSSIAKPGVATDKTIVDGQNNAKSGANADGMSMIAKVGIGVGAGIGAIALVVLASVLLCMRSKRREREAAAAAYGFKGYGNGAGGRYEGLGSTKEYDPYSGDSTPMNEFSRSHSNLTTEHGRPSNVGLIDPYSDGGYADYTLGQSQAQGVHHQNSGSGGSGSLLMPVPGHAYPSYGQGVDRFHTPSPGPWDSTINTPTWAQSPPRQVYQPVQPR
ncbi:hypothetical protein BD324DRAFT_612310 [Kockovaella imperatae]|uniref:Glucose-methanol-choline oxidoreductase N-terminal domain-containing protein n=1 Tax=Kockovaella imperatae TaxID=4999 RepID=A0A1Y1US45_9TREE|nr:hypothetical protein BD324DRAFT_612310 [Kockovaella imperatae]ORX40851.1 hypothetical protein BD324DRAFT_612310 [Kockovaella imperatae]